MSSTAPSTRAVQSLAPGPHHPSRKKGNKKKKHNNRTAADSAPAVPAAAAAADDTPAPKEPHATTNGKDDGVDGASVEDVLEELETGITSQQPPPDHPATVTEPADPDTDNDADTETGAGLDTKPGDDHDNHDQRPAANGHAGAHRHSLPTTGTISGATGATVVVDAATPAAVPPPTSSTPPPESTPAAMSQDTGDIEALRLEVEKLRAELESEKKARAEEEARLRAELEEAVAAREEAEERHQTLLARVEKIKETLGDRLRRDKEELEEANHRVEELEAQNDDLRAQLARRDEEADRLRSEVQEQGRELASLRSRSNLSQQNWQKEKDETARQLQHLRSELESTTAAMGEWEVIAMEERSLRESLADKVADLEEQLAGARESFERADADREAQAQAVDRLQRALQELQETRKRELREMVESAEEQTQALQKRAREADERAAQAEAAREQLAKELERTAPFEKEVKEKNLLIGKLRHEAIVLNDHLTKALKYIKKTKPEETIDKQLITNHILQFLSLDRSDPKKFQILQVIAGLLNWTDEQREKAGLARPGGSAASANHHHHNHHNTLRLPTSPFHRTPSSPALSSEFFSDLPSSTASPATAAGGKESLADLWASFLEQSVAEETGSVAGSGTGSRKDSLASVSTSATGPAGVGRPDTPRGFGG
ncbi:hypothetical protein VTJ04DRAFT_9268 [Mycothermus thermophilus]|uniref:uncharacterized protein n=1 Tax=Humicola insolens TaxID=85995 RepID=UPI003742E90A